MFGLRKRKDLGAATGAATVSAEDPAELTAEVREGELRSAPESVQVPVPAVPWAAIVDPAGEREFQQRKMQLHETVVEALNLKFAAGVEEQASQKVFRSAVTSVVGRTFPDKPAAFTSRMVQELVDEAEGMGPLECLMRDPDITDILVNNPGEVFVERQGVLERTPIVFADTRHLLRVAQRLTARVGRRVDESNPMVDARLADGSRLNVTIPPLAIDGATISIRRFPREPLTLPKLVSKGSLTEPMAEFLQAAVVSRLSFLISGGTGTGKTTLLNALAGAVPHDERIVTVEDSAELRLCHPHVVRMESRLPNTEGYGSV